jgi:hypothetical protein
VGVVCACGGVHREGIFGLYVGAPVLEWKETERGESELDTEPPKFWRVDVFVLCDNIGAVVGAVASKSTNFTVE